jgi:hypothetical protein
LHACLQHGRRHDARLATSGSGELPLAIGIRTDLFQGLARRREIDRFRERRRSAIDVGVFDY